MEYREFLPPPALRPYVACFWTISSHGELAPPDAGTILPDGSVELVLNFADRVNRQQAGGAPEDGLWRMVVGPMERWTRVVYTGKVDLLGIRFQACGAYPFFRVPLQELTGHILQLDALAGPLNRDLASQLDGDWPLPRRIGTLERILLAHLNYASDGDVVVEAAVRAIQETHGQVPLSRVLARCGVSARQLERKFQRVVGLNPKRLCRILRFQRAWQTAERQGPENWSALALACGYYDQAHLIRDFREFAGATPTQAFPEPAP